MDGALISVLYIQSLNVSLQENTGAHPFTEAKDGVRGKFARPTHATLTNPGTVTLRVSVKVPAHSGVVIGARQNPARHAPRVRSGTATPRPSVKPPAHSGAVIHMVMTGARQDLAQHSHVQLRRPGSATLRMNARTRTLSGVRIRLI
jgi:hypothetical protein